MPALLTTEDVLRLYEVAVRRTARCLKLDANEKGFLQLFDEISNSNDTLYTLLDDFIASYRQYQNFHIGLDLKLFNGETITDVDLNFLADRMTDRDNSRNRLIEELNQRGC